MIRNPVSILNREAKEELPDSEFLDKRLADRYGFIFAGSRFGTADALG
jgi:hypothetical protein